jgi:transposase
MIVTATSRVLLWPEPVDFRRGHDGLAALVQQALRRNPFCGDIFVFRSKRADRVKLIGWDGSGLVMVYKRLEESRFRWPPVRDGMVTMTPTQLALLLDGLPWAQAKRRPIMAPEAVC